MIQAQEMVIDCAGNGVGKVDERFTNTLGKRVRVMRLDLGIIYL